MKINQTRDVIDSSIPKNKGCGSLMMDMQEKLLQEVNNKKQIVLAAILQLKTFDLLDIDQCFTEQVPEKLGTTLSSIFAQNSQAPVFSKDTFSAFGCKSFVEWIELKNIDHLKFGRIKMINYDGDIGVENIRGIDKYDFLLRVPLNKLTFS